MSFKSGVVLACLVSACGGAAAPPGAPPADPALTESCRKDLGIQDAKDCAAVSALLLPESLPKAQGNNFADSIPAAQLGFQVFYDPRFSSIPQERCATCHVPEKSFVDGLAVSQGKDNMPLPRNSPSVFTAAWYSEFMWDGRADSLWSQPLFPLENTNEMATTRLDVAHIISSNARYASLYQAAFSAPPDLSDTTRFPASGKPGDPSFDQMQPGDQDTVNRVFANVGKSLEAYMRKVATGRSALDQYLMGDGSLFDQSARAGLATFVKARCIDCHNGPTLSDGLYHDMHVPSLPGAEPDHGRATGLALLAANQFNARGPYADPGDSPPPAIPAQTADADGAFRTPTLRDIAATAPYGHNGYYPTLEALLADHGPTKLSDTEIQSIIVFLLQLAGTYPDRPWSNWPTN